MYQENMTHMHRDTDTDTHMCDGVLLSHKEERNYVIARKWMKLQVVMLSEIIQFHKNNYYMFPLICGH
jgi:hypothetical protein